MNASIFIQGFIIGFSIAAPVGPIGVLCIRRTLANGRLAGLVSGLGAATADAFYGGIAAFGLTAVSGFLTGQQNWIRLIGGLSLLYLGLQTLRAKPASKTAESSQPIGLIGAYLSTLFLTLTNPMTIISFAGIFAGLGIGQNNGNYTSALELVIGAFLGSAAWWLILSTLMGQFREKFDEKALTWVNRMAGIIIIIFGLVALASLIKSMP